jgi:hypothetical protein
VGAGDYYGEDDVAEASGSGSAGIEDDGDVETVVPPPKIVMVTVKKRLITRGLYYIDARRREVDTIKSDWRRVHNGYELQARKHIYVTRSFPS